MRFKVFWLAIIVMAIFQEPAASYGSQNHCPRGKKIATDAEVFLIQTTSFYEEEVADVYWWITTKVFQEKFGLLEQPRVIVHSACTSTEDENGDGSKNIVVKLGIVEGQRAEIIPAGQLEAHIQKAHGSWQLVHGSFHYSRPLLEGEPDPLE